MRTLSGIKNNGVQTRFESLLNPRGRCRFTGQHSGKPVPQPSDAVLQRAEEVARSHKIVPPGQNLATKQ